MYDGSTALILAARLAVEGMVEELITCHADVNAVDELGESAGGKSPRVSARVSALRARRRRTAFKSLVLPPFSGKSALHWAAAVNNVDATIALLKNGANKDMQDLKVRKRKKF